MIRILFFIVISFQLIMSQHNRDTSKKYRPPGTGVISGQVLNDKTSSPIEYASVTLISEESNEAEMGQLTDNNGIFL